MCLEDKLERLCSIVNLQIDLGWREYLRDDRNNIFYYFFSLGLISREDLDAIYSGSGRLRANRHLRAFCAHLNYHFSPRYYRAEAVVDVGAGWGAITHWLLISGARVVYAIGDPARTPFVGRLFEEAKRRRLLPADSEVIPVSRFVRPGQTRFGPEIPDEGAALILFQDVFEHIIPRALPFVLSASYAALKPGGLLISACPNSDTPGFAARVRPHWEGFEERNGVPQRLRRIRELLPDVDLTEAEKLARRTRGLDSEDFAVAAERYRQNGEIPREIPDFAPIDIEQDVMEEGYVSPPLVCRQMRDAGFDAFAYPGMMASRRSRYFQSVARVFPAIFWRLHLFDHTVVFVGRKRPGC